MKWTNQLTSLFKTGCSRALHDEANLRILVINLFTLFGIILTLSFAINSYSQHSLWMAGCLAGVCALLIIARLLLKPEKRLEQQIFPAFLLIFSLTVLMSILIITGGINNTGPLWIFVLPPLAFFFAGHLKGLIIMGLFVAFISVLMFFPGDKLLATSYSFEFKLRLLLSFVTTILFSAVYEFTRQRNFLTIKSLNEQNHYLALHDQLTGLPNRRYVQNFLSREEARAKRNKSPLTLMLCDIDKFKRINDLYGHDCGDHVLQQFSKVMQNAIRAQDLLSRWGGEEFLFILPDTDAQNAQQLANLIRDKLQRQVFSNVPEKETITASFGIATLAHDKSSDTTLSNADKALYHAKHQGRDRVILYAELSE